MKKVLIGLMMSGMAMAGTMDYTLTYSFLEEEGGAVEVALSIFEEDGFAFRYEKCYGVLDSYEGLSEEEVLVSTEWQECFIGDNPDEVVTNLLVAIEENKDPIKKAKKHAKKTKHRVKRKVKSCPKMKHVDRDRKMFGCIENEEERG